MDFVRVASATEIPVGGMKGLKVGEKDLVIANVGGKFYALEGLCSHRQGILANGKLEGSVITCPRHGSQFDVTSGKVIAGPKILGFRGTTDAIKAFEVKVEGTEILVGI